jgi:hypothetical protein
LFLISLWCPTQEVKSFKTTDEMEAFMLLHGERIVDTLGAQVDRIETNLKVCQNAAENIFL